MEADKKKSGVSIRPDTFTKEALCTLPFEEAIKACADRSGKVQPHEWHETSVRFCVSGLLKRYRSFARQNRMTLSSLLRDMSWHWASYCVENPTLSGVTTEYFSLLLDLTERYSYVDLEDQMDTSSRLKQVGFQGPPTNIKVAPEAHGIIADSGMAIGIPFSLHYQIGLSWSLSTSDHGKYAPWVKDIFQPLFREMLEKTDERLQNFSEIRIRLEHRENNSKLEHE